jgi:methionyl-tRNA formyltransferase
MRIVFWGSPDFAVPSLDALLASTHQVVGVVTQPPRPKGRGRKVETTAVARRAAEEGLPVLAPARPRGAEFVERLGALAADLFVVVAYGAILPGEALALPRHGAINVHASLLPDLRGAAPVTRAILEGRGETGVTIMRMDTGLDTGPILLQSRTAIALDDTADSLTGRLAHLGAKLVVEAVDRLAAGTLEERPQDDDAASWAPKVEAAEAELDWRRPAGELERKARAFDPWPGAWTTRGGERLKVFRIEPLARSAAHGSPTGSDRTAAPGTIVALGPAPVVRVGDGLARLAEVQPAGARRMAGDAWARGHRVEIGERLGA